MEKVLSIVEAKSQFSDCVRTAEGGSPVVITRHGKPVVAVVSSLSSPQDAASASPPSAAIKPTQCDVRMIVSFENSLPAVEPQVDRSLYALGPIR